MDKKKFEERISEAWEKYRAEDVFPNVMLLGASGVGKSSLINHVFGDTVASVNDVEPETNGFNIYMGEDYGRTINLIDSPGYELGAEQYFSDVIDTVNEGAGGEPVHIIWYCISVANGRVEDIDIELLNRLMDEEKLEDRICVVFTKTDMDSTDLEATQAMKSVLDEELNYDVKTFSVSVEDCNDFDLAELIAWSAVTLDDEDLKDKFIGAQIRDLDKKKEKALETIAIASAAAAGIGAVPIPFADAILLVPDQVLMVKRILDIYGVSSFAHVSAQFIGSIFISQLGKLLASSLIKLIPFVGSWVGGVVNASVAGIITCAIGTVTSEICYKSIKDYFNGTEVDWENIFTAKNFSEKVSETAKAMFDSGSFANNTSEEAFSEYMNASTDIEVKPYDEQEDADEDETDDESEA